MQEERLDFDKITIADNLMFVTVFSDPERCKRLLERLLAMRIRRVVITSSEHALITGIDAKSIRMDVYAEDDENTVYDIEMQRADPGSLGKRTRYYQSTIDMDCLNRGEDYARLRKTFILFICLFDPFEAGLARYTVVPTCRESGEELDDGAMRVFFNASAWQDCADEHMRAVLHYFAGGTIEGDDFVNDIDAAVCKTREEPSWRRERMRLDQYLRDETRAARAEARKEGLAEGLAEGREQGRAEGREQGRAEGRELGRKEGFAEGVAEGVAEGRKEAIAEGCRDLRRLMQAVKADGRLEEILAALDDEEQFDVLLAEYGIGTESAMEDADFVKV